VLNTDFNSITMKKLIILLSIFLSLAINAQEYEEFKTIFGGRSVGGYGALGGGYTLINNDNAMIFTGRGGVVLGHVLSMGIGGSGFISEYQYDPVLLEKTSLAGGYGGVYLELILFGRSPVHLSFPALIGLGGTAYTVWSNEGADFERENRIEQTATFGIFEPGVELEFNITRFFRFAAYLNYRYTSNISITKLVDNQPVNLVAPDALNGYTAGIIFKFGKF
jgi:hypothetical protein